VSSAKTENEIEIHDSEKQTSQINIAQALSAARAML